MGVLLIALPLVVQAAGPCPGEWRAVAALEVASRADSVRTRDSLLANPGACAQVTAAYLGAFLTRPGSEHWQDRLAAERLLDEAMPGGAPDPRLLLAYGYLRYQQGIRLDARRLVNRALGGLASAVPAPSPREQAGAEYLFGRMVQDEWRDWRSFGQLMGLSVGRWSCEPYLMDLAAMVDASKGQGAVAAATSYELPSAVDVNVACPAQFEAILDDDFHLNADLKGDARRDLETRFREAIAHDATYWPPYQALASELVFEANWAALDTLARAGRVTLPHDYRPAAMLALATYRLGDAAAGNRLFDSALAMMPPDLAAFYRQPDPVLSIAEQRAFAAQPKAVQDRLTGPFWRSRQGSFLGDGNDRLLEHYARLTEAELLFGIPARGLAGWHTAPGSAWMRYGRPLKIRDLAIQAGRASFWSYGPDPDLVFTRMLTFEEYHLHEHVTAHVQLLHEKVPARFRPPGVDSVVALEHQIARFRGDSGGTDLLIVAGPSSRFSQATEGRAGVTLLDEEFQPVARWRSERIPEGGVAMTIRGVKARTYNLAVELLDRERGVLAQARDTLTVRSPGAGAAVSDLLVVRGVDGPEEPTTRAALRIEHLYGRTVGPGEDVGLVWEVYSLLPDRNGAWRYRVRLEVKDAEGKSLLTRLLGGERPGTTVEYERAAVPVGDRSVEWVNLTGGWKPGRYQVVLRVEDLVGRRSVETTTYFEVVRDEGGR